MNMQEKVRALEALRDRLRAQYSGLPPEKAEIGDFTYGFPIIRTWGEENARLKVGRFCSIGGNVQIYLGGNHHTDWLTTYPFNVLLKDVYPNIDGGVAATKGDVIIGNDVWIASDVTIMSGVTIGDGAVIANGAVVTRNVPECCVYGGVPARFIKYRYAAKAAVDVRWWNWPLDTLAEAIPVLMSNDTNNPMMCEGGVAAWVSRNRFSP